VTCTGADHLRQELARVEILGGEGLMLRRPKSMYEVGRSSSLLKVKTFHDTEARVIGHAPGTGKHKGRLGALIVELPDGTKFNVGTGFSDEERENPPAIGAVITFRYQELSKDGVPRFPSYVGERIDVKLPAPAKAKTTPAPATSPLKITLVNAAENKFWTIEVKGTAHVTTFGRLGTPGQQRLVNLASENAARSDADKRAQQKQREGYVLVP
jgi:DNA ligase-1